LHQLAVEDAVHEHQRPKLDRYETRAFLTAYAVRLDTATGMLDKLEVAAFITYAGSGQHAAITGFYGQNVPYPGTGKPWGFWVSTVATVVVSVALYGAFRRRDWL